MSPTARPLWRVFPWSPAAEAGERFSADHVPGRQGRGRFDLTGRSQGVLYLAESPEHAIAESLQKYRNQGEPLEDADLIVWGHRLALVSATLEGTVWSGIADLCDPDTLAHHRIHPDATAARSRATSQAVSANLYEAGKAGLRWWSAFFGEWHSVVLFLDRLPPDSLSYAAPEPLSPTHPHVIDSGRMLDIG